MRAGIVAGRAVHAEFEAKGMDRIPDRLHAVGELGQVCQESAVTGSARRPTVVEDHILVAQVSKSEVDYFLRGTE